MKTKIYFNKAIVNAIEKVIDYICREEYNHWEEENNPEHHIFHSVNELKNWLNNHKNKEA